MRGFTRRRPWPGRGRGMEESWLQRALAALPVEADSAQRRTLPGVADSFALIASAAHTGAGAPAPESASESGAEGARWIVAVSDRSGGDAVLAALAAAAAEPSPPAVLAACAPHWDGASRWLLSRLGAPAVGDAGLAASTPTATSSAANASTGAVPATAAPAAPGIWPLCLPEERGAVLARAESAPPAALPPERLAEGLAEPAREVFGRAALAMRGLAAKHGGTIRSAAAPGAALELVLLAQPVATLRAEVESGEAVLELAGRRIPLRGDGAGLTEPLDRLEAQLRKRAGDRRARGGEDGARARLLTALAEAAALRHLRRWPLAGEGAALDGLGLLPGGQIALLAARPRLGLPELAAFLRAAWAAGPSLPLLLRDAPAPLRLDSRPALLLAAPAVDGAARAALRWLSPVSLWQAGSLDGPLKPLSLPGALGESAPARGEAALARGDSTSARGESAGAPRPRRRRGRGRRSAAQPGEGPGGPGAGRAPEGASSRGAPEDPAAGSAFGPDASGGPGASGPNASGPGGASGPSASDSGAGEPGAGAPGDANAPGGAGRESGFDEVSLFDLDSESGEERPPRRRRSGRRGRRSGESSRDSGEAEGAEARGERERGRGRSRRGRGRRSAASRSGAAEDSAASGAAGAGEAGDAQSAEEDSLDEVMQLSPDAPEILDPGDYDRLSALGGSAAGRGAPGLDGGGEDADADAGESESEIERMRSERERRRSARAEAGGGLPQPGDEPPDEASELPRGRVAILAHADRQSIIAGVLLAREVRQLEGIWIYPQSELMTFFRSVATDLPGRTPIYVVGFAAKPARETLQAASLYQGRLAWFDHHEWPPEDLEAMRGAIGAPLAHLHPGTHSSLPAALAFCTWRSRLSSKLVDLVTGAFTQHDFEKWGHLWWWRLGQMSQQTGGPRRDELAPLLTGRPSELTEAAERAPAPPLPEEAAWAAQRHFRLVRFGGLGMVVAEVPESLDLHMAMRIAREPHGAQISLARNAGEEIFVLAADEPAGQGRVDTAAMALHLSQKFDWVEALPDADRVTRFRARGVVEQPGRLEELIAEIGMGRAILEG